LTKILALPPASRDRNVYLFKNNTDSAGNSCGCHENYLVGRHGEFGRLADILIPFLVIRWRARGADAGQDQGRSSGPKLGETPMARRNSGLLAEIERDALDESKSVSSALRKCLALGGQAGSAELRQWASRELNGYPDDVPLPGYRKIRTPLVMDGFDGGGIFRGRQVSVIDLPQEARGVVGDELPLTFGAAKIEALARQAEESGKPVEMGPAAGAELALMMTSEVGRYRVERVYWAVGAGVLRGAVESIRTALAELVTEIRSAMPAEDATPTAEAVGQAVQVAVSGKRNRVTVAAAGAGGTATASSGGGASEERRFWTWPRVGMFIVGLATVAGAVAAILALHPF
jgi:hypothetical protein